LAVAKPMPALAPVTTATRPAWLGTSSMLHIPPSLPACLAAMSPQTTRRVDRERCGGLGRIKKLDHAGWRFVTVGAS
jgi:hypothetical protein